MSQKQPRKWQGQVIEFPTVTTTTILPGSSDLESMDTEQMKHIMESIRETQADLDEYMDVLSSYWLDFTKKEEQS